MLLHPVLLSSVLFCFNFLFVDQSSSPLPINFENTVYFHLFFFYLWLFHKLPSLLLTYRHQRLVESCERRARIPPPPPFPILACKAFPSLPPTKMAAEPSRTQLSPVEIPDTFRVETPAAMLARLRAESAAKKAAARAAAMSYIDDLLVGSEPTYLAKDDVFGPGVGALRRFFSRPSPEESVVVTHPLSVKEQVVRYQRPRTDHDPFVAVYTPLPHIGEEQARKLMERGFSNSSNVAMDMSIQSHVGQGTPLLAMCAIMDSRTDDPNEALQVAGYFDLGRDKCDLISLPLINFPLNKEDFDDYNEPMPDVGEHQFSCIPPPKGTPQTTLLTSDGHLRRPNFTLPRSASTRFTMPLNMRYSGRNSVDTIARSSNYSNSSSKRQDPDLLEGQGPKLDFSQIIFPTVVERNFSNPQREVLTTLKELYGDSFETLQVSTPSSYGGEKLKGKVFYSTNATFQRDDLVAGKILATFKIADILSSPNLGSLLFSEVMSGSAILRVTVKVLLNKYTAFGLKIFYDELAQIGTSETAFDKISVLPGAIFSSQEEQFSFDFELFTPGVSINFKVNEGFGRISLAALSACNLSEHMPDNFSCTFDFSVVDISTTFYNLGESNMLEIPNFPVHLTGKSASIATGAKAVSRVFTLNLYELGTVFNKFQSLLNHLEGYSGDLVIDWLITASALTNGRVYILPVFDNNSFEKLSEEKLHQCGYNAKQLSMERRGILHLPFNSWYGSYTKDKFPSLLFFFPNGVCGPSGETIHITVHISRILNLVGMGHRLFKNISLEGQGPNPYSFHLFYLHCGNVQTTALNKGGLWCVPVSPFNLAAYHEVDGGIDFNTNFVTKTHNWLHFLASSSSYWRGSLTYQLRVTFNKRDSATRKLVAFYTTQNQGLFGHTSALVGDTGISSVIGDTFSVDITIPFLKPTMWLRTYRVAFNYESSCNGCIYFQLPTKDATSVQLWVRANSDFDCARFRILKTSPT
nr:polyprotein [Currant latent virus]